MTEKQQPEAVQEQQSLGMQHICMLVILVIMGS